MVFFIFMKIIKLINKTIIKNKIENKKIKKVERIANQGGSDPK